MKYTAVIERASTGTWSAYVPDLPTILAMADTREELEEHLREAIQLWIEEESADGRAIPPPCSQTLLVDIAA